MTKPTPLATHAPAQAATQTFWQANHELVIAVAAILIAGAIIGTYVRFRDWIAPRLEAAGAWLVEHRPYVTFGPPPKPAPPPAPEPLPPKHLSWKVHLHHDPNDPTPIIAGKSNGIEYSFFLPIHVTNTGNVPSKSFNLELHFGPPFSVDAYGADRVQLDTEPSDIGKKWRTFDLQSLAMLDPLNTELLGFVRLRVFHRNAETSTVAYWRIVSEFNRYWYPSPTTFGKLQLKFNHPQSPPQQTLEDTEQPPASESEQQ